MVRELANVEAGEAKWNFALPGAERGGERDRAPGMLAGAGTCEGSLSANPDREAKWNFALPGAARGGERDRARGTVADRIVDAVTSGWIVLVLAAATVLLNQTAGMLHETAASEHTVEASPRIAPLARALTIPLTLPQTTDARAWVLPIGLAGLLLLAALRPSHALSVVHAAWPRWFVVCAGVLVCAAILSALVNGSWALSRGWIFHLCVALGWAGVLAAIADGVMVRRVFVGMLAVAAIAAAMTLWHRHVAEIRDVRWPIGGITTCAALGAVWAALACGFLANPAASPKPASSTPGRHAKAARTALALVVAGLAIALVVLSGRRAGWLGLIAAGVLLAAAVVVRRLRPRAARLVLASLVGVAFFATGAWLLGNLLSPHKEVSGSLHVRLVLWSTAIERFLDRPLLGFGPDMFVCEITTALARPSAEAPHVLHGDIYGMAHCEWLQAFFEVGLAGGTAYLLIPLLLLGLAANRYCRGATPPAQVYLCAALLAIVVLEFTTVNLRYPPVWTWYWTLMGMALAVLRSEEAAARTAWPLPNMNVVRFSLVAVSMAIIATVSVDLRAVLAHTEGRRVAAGSPLQSQAGLVRAQARLGAAAWLQARVELACAQLRLADLQPGSVRDAPPAARGDGGWAARSAATWQSVVDRCPGYPDAGFGLSRALQSDGRPPEARAALETFMTEVNPYHAAANLMWARCFATGSEERVTCVLRALRSSGMTPALETLTLACLEEPRVSQAWGTRVRAAEHDTTRLGEPEWNDPLAPEILRMQSAHARRIGNLPEAARLERIAAEAYGRLFAEHSPRRRAAPAEWNTWLRAAELTFEADPAEFRESYRMVREAEHFAARGIAHEYVRDPDPSLGFVDGVVVPAVLPDHLCPLWRTSAKLHMALGEFDRLERRIVASLPAERRSAADFAARQRELARELADAFARVPENRRPNHFSQLIRLAEREPFPVDTAKAGGVSR